MKIFYKFFLTALLILTASIAFVEYSMISSNFRQEIAAEKEATLEQYRVLCRTIQSELSRCSSLEDAWTRIEDNLNHTYSEEYLIQIRDQNDLPIYQSRHRPPVLSDSPREGTILWTVIPQKKQYFSYASGQITGDQNQYDIYFARNCTYIFTHRKNLLHIGILGYLLAVSLSVIFLFVITWFLVRPLTQMQQAAGRIARGDYSSRTQIQSHDEIGDLSQSFDHMALTIENNIATLQRQAKEKEDFAANLTHELKTPLTSVIGYADRICRASLSPEEIRVSAEYIWSEGMRLEALTRKLMQLFHLSHQPLTKEVISTTELCEDIRQTCSILGEQRHIEISIFLEPAYIRVEYDLFKTVLTNLIDNAIKADSLHIQVRGRRLDKTCYQFEIADDGCGMEQKELSRIQEAFYMVDKARSRSQNGAGLGLALTARILHLHDTGLHYESEPGKGTCVSFSILYESDWNETDEEI